MVLTRHVCTSLAFLVPVRTLPGSMNKFLQHHRKQFALLNSPAICITWADRRLVSQQRRLKRQRHCPLQNWPQCDIRNWTTDGCKSCFHLEKTALQTVSYKVGNIDQVVGKKCAFVFYFFSRNSFLVHCCERMAPKQLHINTLMLSESHFLCFHFFK